LSVAVTRSATVFDELAESCGTHGADAFEVFGRRAMAVASDAAAEGISRKVNDLSSDRQN
jgi:hypothetical protein